MKLLLPTLKKRYKILFGLVALAALVKGIFITLDWLVEGSWIEFASSESTNLKNEPVINRIMVLTSHQSTEYYMEQNHNWPKKDKWNKFKISVDSQNQVSFHQFREAPPSAEYPHFGREINVSADCLKCHANGPRAIRPFNSHPGVKVSWVNQLKIAWINLKISAMGKTSLEPKNNSYLTLNSEPNPVRRLVSLTSLDRDSNDPLPAQVMCLKCHNENGFLSRGALTKRHHQTALHLLNNGSMPPWPYQLSDSDRRSLTEFFSGPNSFK
jgi:hypothetical protein